MADLEGKEKRQDCHEETTEEIMECLIEPQIKFADSKDDEDDFVDRLLLPARTSECFKYIELIQSRFIASGKVLPDGLFEVQMIC